LSKQKTKIMEKEMVRNLIREEINQKLINLIEELSDNEFIEFILDKIHDETGEEVEIEKVKGIVGYEVMINLKQLIPFV